LVQYAGLEANYQEEQLEVEQLRQMVSDQTTAQLQATKKWQSLEEELSRSVKNEEHLRGTVQDRINDTRSMMTRQRLSMETNQLQLTEAQHQITRLTTERRELEGKFSKDVQSISDSLGKCRQEKTDLQTLLDVARSELLKATTELTIVKTREEHRKRPRDEPVEQLKAKVQFLEAQHDSDTKDLRRAREDIANYMRKLVEYEVSNIK
jgi:chromosome segregation ATPase